MTTPRIEEIKNQIKESVIATYPEDIFPTPSDISHLKDNNVAYIMREMAGAIASIVSQTIEQTLTEAQKEERERCIKLVKDIDTGFDTMFNRPYREMKDTILELLTHSELDQNKV